MKFPWATHLIVTGRTKAILVKKVLPMIKKFLAERGLKLSKKKTRITCINQGFDFLGQNIRKYQDGKLLIKPSKDSYKRVLKKIREKLKKYKMNTHEEVICVLNPIIKGWTNYHRHVCSSSTFSKFRHEIWKALWLWCRSRHKAEKSAQWMKNKYFIRVHGQDWCFAYKKKTNDKVINLTIANPTKVKIVRHIKVNADLNPYDDNWQQYLEFKIKQRMLQSLNANKKLLSLWKAQQGICPICKQNITSEIGWEIHHIKEKSRGGEDNLWNLVLLHHNCHKQVHCQKIKVVKPGFEKSLSKSLSRMRGNSQVRFLEGGKKATSFFYSAINIYLYTYFFVLLMVCPGISYGFEAQDNSSLLLQDIQKRAQQNGFNAHGLVDSAIRNAGNHEAPIGENKLTDNKTNSTQQKRFDAQELVDNASRSIEREIATGKHKALVIESSKQLTEKHLADAKELAEQVNLKQKQLSLKDLGIEVTGGKLADRNGVNIGELLSRYNSKKFLEKDSDQLPGLMVFISLSMPEDSLKQLAIQISQAGGVLVLRGMYEGSLQKTINAIYELNKQGVSAIIHPEFFRKYDVRTVPTFVLEDKEGGTCKFGNCTRVFDKLTGNVSLQYVLEKFVSDGSNSKVALRLLERIGGKK